MMDTTNGMMVSVGEGSARNCDIVLYVYCDETSKSDILMYLIKTVEGENGHC